MTLLRGWPMRVHQKLLGEWQCAGRQKSAGAGVGAFKWPARSLAPNLLEALWGDLETEDGQIGDAERLGAPAKAPLLRSVWRG